MAGIGEVDSDPMHPRTEALNDERLTSRVDPMPIGIIDGDVKVSDARPYGQRRRPEHVDDAEILGAILEHD